MFYLIRKSFYIACLFTSYISKTSKTLKSLIKGVVVMADVEVMVDAVEPEDVADAVA